MPPPRLRDKQTGRFASYPAVNARILENNLRKLYYDPQNPASFSSVETLYQASKGLVRNLKREDVREWLMKQDAYRLHKPTLENFARRKILVPRSGHQYQADLMDVRGLDRRLSEHNDNIRYLQIVIDCFSRFATAVPMKFKTGQRSRNALRKAFKNMGKEPKKIQTDRGTEYYNVKVARFLREKQIVHFSTFQHDIKASMAERFIRTLRGLLSRFQTASKTRTYIHRLDQILTGYNNRKHSAFKMQFSPAQVHLNRGIHKKAFGLLYDDYFQSLGLSDAKFKIGDIVLKAYDKKGSKLRKKYKTFDDTRFEIVEILPTEPITYVLKTHHNKELVSGTFYEDQLQKVII